MPRPVRVECRKWPDDPHWEFDGVLLGVDAHGTWIGITQGTLLASPVRAFQAAADHVTLVPHDAWWLGTFYGDDPKRPFDTYVDIAMPAVWHGADLVRAVDLDLDVIRGTTGPGLGRRRGRVRRAPRVPGLSRRRDRTGDRQLPGDPGRRLEEQRPPSTGPTATGSSSCTALIGAMARVRGLCNLSSDCLFLVKPSPGLGRLAVPARYRTKVPISVKHLWALLSTLVLSTALVVSGVQRRPQPLPAALVADRASTGPRRAVPRWFPRWPPHGFFWQLTAPQDVLSGSILMAREGGHRRLARHPQRPPVLQDQQHGQQRRARGRAARLPPRREGDRLGGPGLRDLLDPARRDRPGRDQPRPLRWRPARLGRRLPPGDPRPPARRRRPVRGDPRLRQRHPGPRHGLGPRRRPDAVPAPDLALRRPRRRRRRPEEP